MSTTTTTMNNVIKSLAKSWGIKNCGTAAKLTAKAVINVPCGAARFEKRAVKAQARSAKAFKRLTRLADEHTAYCLCYEAQRKEWLENF